jgi:hypothetical protein
VCGSVTQIGCDGFNPDNLYQQQLGSTGSGLPPASLSGTFGLAGAQISAQLYALASSYGVLHASAASTVNVSTPAYISAGGKAISQDIITISNPLLTGQIGYLKIGYILNAAYSISGVNSGWIRVGVEVGPTLGQAYSSYSTSSTSGTTYTIPQSFTFIYGQPFGLYLVLQAVTVTNSLTLTTGIGSASVGVSDSLTLSSLGVEDQNGSPVAGPRLVPHPARCTRQTA